MKRLLIKKISLSHIGEIEFKLQLVDGVKEVDLYDTEVHIEGEYIMTISKVDMDNLIKLYIEKNELEKSILTYKI